MNTQDQLKIIKILYWFAFLRISTSYRDAQLVNGGRLKFEAANTKHPDFQKVINRYTRIERVWRKNPIDLMFENTSLFSGIFDLRGGVKVLSRLDGKKREKTGQIVQKLTNYVQDEWGRYGYRDQFIISLPTKINKNKIFEQIKKALDDYIEDFDEVVEEQAQKKPRALILELSKTKIRMEVLERCYNLILIKALNPDITALEQARLLGVSKDKVALLDEALALKSKLGKTAEEYDKVANIHEYQINIEAVVWKYTRRAYLLAENAARGEFPSFKEFDAKKPSAEFAYEHIAEMAKQIQEKMNLDGFVKPFSDEFMGSEQIERCYNTFPKYYEVLEETPKVEPKPKPIRTNGEEENSTFAMVRDLRRIGIEEKLRRRAERRKRRIAAAMEKDAKATSKMDRDGLA